MSTNTKLAEALRRLVNTFPIPVNGVEQADRASLRLALLTAREALAAHDAEQAAQAVPAVGSPEARALIDSELAAYGWPANPKNAARVGYEACRKLMQPPQPAPEAPKNEWRELALKFDGQRMAALSHLRMLLEHGEAHAEAARKFLAEPPHAAPAPEAEAEQAQQSELDAILARLEAVPEPLFMRGTGARVYVTKESFDKYRAAMLAAARGGVMALEAWHVDTTLGKEPCDTERKSWQCPNMLPVEGDLSMTHEHYVCQLCGRRVALDYDEMR